MLIFESVKESSNTQSGEEIVSQNIFELLAEQPDGVMFYPENRIAVIDNLGVRISTTMSCPEFLTSIIEGDECHLSVFGTEYKYRKRTESCVLTKVLDTTQFSGSLIPNLEKFSEEVMCGSGVSFIGSISPLTVYPIMDELIKSINSPVLEVYKSKSHYICNHYINGNLTVSSSSKFTDLESIISYLYISPVKVVIIDGVSGFSIPNSYLDLAKSGKSIIAMELGFSSVYSLHKAMRGCDKGILASLFSGALFADTLPVVKETKCPKVLFGCHAGYKKWGMLSTSPKKTELVHKEPIEGVLSISKGAVWLSELIVPSKPLSKWIRESLCSSDMISNLRLGGWLSLADEAAIAARDEIVTFDSVLRNITLV